MLPLLCLLAVCLLSPQTAELSQSPQHNNTELNYTAAAGTGGDFQLNETRNGTLEEHGTFSAQFGFSDLAGVRPFSPEQEMESRIIGGQEAWAHSWPWQVSLRLASMPACGGAVIGPTWVVSAAHCFKRFNKASLWTVQAGTHDLDNPHEAGQQLVGVAVIFSHRGYDPRTKDSDVALLRLQTPLEFGRFVRPIDIWTAPLPLHRKCTITGWGSTRENGPRVTRLQEVNVTVLSPETCGRFYLGRIRPSMFCAGRDQGGADACQGDSGGPLSCFTGSRYELAGVVSWGVGCGRARRPGVYTRMEQHRQWLSDVMSDRSSVMADEPAEEPDRCGRRQSSGCVPGPARLTLTRGAARLGGVAEACPASWPWQVSLQADGRHYCSGTLLHPRWVLTARGCRARAKEDVAVLGAHDLRFSSSQSVPVDEVFDLPQDGSFPPRDDLSLLRLAVPARLSADVSPVCVPDEDEELDDSWRCFTAGWGSTKAYGADPNRLHHAELGLVNQTSCEDQWGGGLIRDAHLCSEPAGSASCMGDPGAPLYCRKRGAYFLFGVVSWGSRRCDPDRPGVFTRVSDYRAWIATVTGDV